MYVFWIFCIRVCTEGFGFISKLLQVRYTPLSIRLMFFIYLVCTIENCHRAWLLSIVTHCLWQSIISYSTTIYRHFQSSSFIPSIYRPVSTVMFNTVQSHVIIQNNLSTTRYPVSLQYLSLRTVLNQYLWISAIDCNCLSGSTLLASFPVYGILFFSHFQIINYCMIY